MAKKSAKKAAQKTVAAKPAPTKKPSAEAAVKPKYPWLLRRFTAALAKSVPPEHEKACRAALKDVLGFKQAVGVAAEFGFDESDGNVVQFVDDTVANQLD